MKKTTIPSPRRRSALSRDHIVAAAIELLDAHGESGLTFQALSKRLATGPGAIYWHVADKSDLLSAACDAVISPLFHRLSADATPREAIHAASSMLFDTIDSHPWVGSVLTSLPGRMPMVRVLECLGKQVTALGVSPNDQWTHVSTLLMYILGVAGQNAANAKLAMEMNLNRSEFLDDVSAAWSKLPEEDYPFTRRMAERVRTHDDREDFLTGVDLIVRGALPTART